MVRFHILFLLTLSFDIYVKGFNTNESISSAGSDRVTTNASHRSRTKEIYTDGELNMRIERDAKTGVPRTIYGLQYPSLRQISQFQPHEVADKFLKRHQRLMKIDDVISLLIFGVKTTPAGATVHYQHRFNYINVYESRIAVTMNQKGDVTFVSSSYKTNVFVPSVEPLVNERQAIRAMKKELEVRGEVLEPLHSELIIFVNENQTSSLAWCIRGQVMKEHKMSFEFIYDANNGENLQMKNLLMDKNGERSVTKGVYNALSSEKNKSLRRLESNGFTTSFLRSMLYNQLLDSSTRNKKTNFIIHVDGTATVFDPNPLAAAKKKYGEEGLIDNFDEVSSVLKGVAKTVVLRDIAFDSKNYFLDGTFATYDDFDPPFDRTLITILCSEPRLSSPTPDFKIDRSDKLFEAVSAYYHIDTMMRHVNEDLNIELMPSQYDGGVRFDSDGVNEKDNSYYNRQTQTLSFGSGGVDDAEDADVVIHELAYGFYDWLTLGGMSMTEGLAVVSNF